MGARQTARRPVLRVLRVITLLTILLPVLIPTPSQASSDTAAKIAGTRKQIEESRKRLAQAEKRASGIQMELKRLDSQLSDLDKQIRTGETDISGLESDVRSSQVQIDELTRRYQKAVAASNDRARRLYKTGPASSLTMLFTTSSVLELTRLQFWWEKSSEQDSKTMIQAASLKADLQERQNSLNEIRLDLGKQRSWLRQRKSIMAGARADRDRALTGAQNEIAAQKREIAALEADNRRLTETLSKRPVTGDTGPVSRSGFIRPLNGPITSPFGRRWGGTHTGVDIDGNTGDPIKAPKSGTILSIPCGSGYGVCLIMDNGGGVTTLYAHMSRKARGPGPIKQGEVLGYVGSTGISTGSHLHWELRIQGVPQNPMSFV